MMAAIKTFLNACVAGLTLSDGSTAAYPEGTVFFGELPRDFLKDHNYAVSLLCLQDKKRKDGRLIGRVRNEAMTAYTMTRRRFSREILMRCFLWAPVYDLSGDGDYIGLCDQLEQAMAETRVFADAGNGAVFVELEDCTRPWNSDVSEGRKKRRPELAIVRVRFIGGIKIQYEIPIVTDVEITPTAG